MIEIPALTPEILAELGRELGGRDFTSANQQAFLLSTTSRDVQAVPGNGKTTLLVAKLALLSRTWTSRKQGVCVISHTNAARQEVEKKLAAHPSASAFLSYPHFIGTVTAFINQFIALPYLRGFGWSVQRIDDEVFEAVAKIRYRSYTDLLNYARMNRGANARSLEGFVSKLELAPDFESQLEPPAARLKVRHRHRQPRPPSATGIALEQLKAELVNEGLYRYGDMTALALQALEKYPGLVERIRTRFPLVLLDEAQDTNGVQLTLLNRLFSGRTAFQRLGDQNQTLYEDDDLGPEDYWTAGAGVIPLDRTRRFGPEVAAFASRLTVRAPQQIGGTPGIPSRRTLILFDEASIGTVLQTYASEVRAHWEEAVSQLEVWAVASRHNPPQGAAGNWPRSLVDYHPQYRSGRGRNSRPETLCSALRQAAVLHETYTSPAEIVDLMTAGIVMLLRHQGVVDVRGKLIDKRTVWSFLGEKDVGLPLKLKRLMRDTVFAGTGSWESEAWREFCSSLTALLGIDPATAAATNFLAFVEDGAPAAEEGEQSRTVTEHDGVAIRLGSVHSVKGKTVDAILVMETEVWRSSHRAMDLATVLPHAFGVETRDFTGSPAQLSAATNTFVAATRARQVLAFAMRKQVATEAMQEAARDQGWNVIDITARNEANEAAE
jgi:DNA helicase II / ATP-dependent DNA helicase PcrA